MHIKQEREKGKGKREERKKGSKEKGAGAYTSFTQPKVHIKQQPYHLNGNIAPNAAS